MIYNLRNVLNDFEEISFEEYKEDIEFDEGDSIKENNREAIFINKIHNQSIVFHEYRYENEEKLGHVSEIPDYISDSAYNYICNILNNNDNITIFWSQVYGTTSDYVIIYGHYFTNGKQCREYINNYADKNYKYLEIKNDNCCKCDC